MRSPRKHYSLAESFCNRTGEVSYGRKMFRGNRMGKGTINTSLCPSTPTHRAAPLSGRTKSAGAVDCIWKFLEFNTKSLQIQSHYSDLYLEALQFPLSPSQRETEFRKAAPSQRKCTAVSSF
jgi:hypothetical protein